MKKPTKQQLLQRYQARELKRFIQIEGLKIPHDDWNVMQPDEDGFWFQVRPAYELSDGEAGLSVLIDPRTDLKDAGLMLKKIAGKLGHEWASLLQEIREEAEEVRGLEGVAESLIRIRGFHLDDFESLVRIAKEKLAVPPRKSEEDCPFW